VASAPVPISPALQEFRGAEANALAAKFRRQAADNWLVRAIWITNFDRD